MNRIRVFAIALALAGILSVFYWWLYSHGPYPFLTLDHELEIEESLSEYWRSKNNDPAFPPPHVEVVSVFEYTDNCSVVSVILYFRQGSQELANENPAPIFYKLTGKDKKWTIVSEEGGFRRDIRQQPSTLNCES